MRPLSCRDESRCASRRRAARNAVEVHEGTVRVYVTTVPEGGKATRDVVKLLAKAMGRAKSEFTLVRGETSRDKVFALDGAD